MANGDDTDVMDDQSAADDSGLDDTAGGVGTVSAAQQPMEIPGGLGGDAGGLTQGLMRTLQGGMTGQPSNQNVPASRGGGWGDLDEAQSTGMTGSQAVQGRHGGLVTGLAGLLIDGLAAGMAPDRRSAMELPFKMQAAAAQRQQMQMRDQQMQMQQQKLEMEMAEEPAKTAALWAKAKIDMMHTFMASRNLKIAEVKDNLGSWSQVYDAAVKSGEAEHIASADTLEQAFDAENKAQQADKNSHFGIGPKLDQAGSPTGYEVVRVNPKGSLGTNTPFHLDPVPDIPGQPGSGYKGFDQTFDRNTQVGVFTGVTAKELAARAQAQTMYNDYQKQQEQQRKDVMAQQKEDVRERHEDVVEARAERAEGRAERAETRQEQALGLREQAAGQKEEALTVVPQADGTNQVMPLSQVPQGQMHYPLKDPQQITAFAGSMNDLQTAVNQTAKVNFANVQAGLAAALLEKQTPALSGIIHVSLPQRAEATLRAENLEDANQDTRNYVAAIAALNEGITQLPRLQTFGKSSRFSQEQVHAAQMQLPQPGDDSAMAQQKLHTLQNMIDPLRHAAPRMQGAELIPSFREPGGEGMAEQKGKPTPKEQVGSAFEKWSKQHPEAAKHLGDILNFVTKGPPGQ